MLCDWMNSGISKELFPGRRIMSLKDCKIVTLPLCPTHTPYSVFHAIEPWYNERYGHV